MAEIRNLQRAENSGIVRSAAESLARMANGGEGAVLSESEARRMKSRADRTFGVELLSYKNMWNVLKTVDEEIGVIKKASLKRFSLSVSKQLDKPMTLMQFNSLVDYLKEHSDTSLQNMLSNTPKDAVEQVISDSFISLQTQANIEPEAALQLLTLDG